MGLTNTSVGSRAISGILDIKRLTPDEKVVAIAGNPNVGKSTLFNNLTGLRQHTGNWPGKTVANALGRCHSGDNSYILVDIPGTYSLMAHSAEEEVARGFICFGEPDAVVVVCDATCLERNMNLVLQTMEISEKVIVCVNLIDEAKRKNITVNLDLISERLGVPVVGAVARKKKSLVPLVSRLDSLGEGRGRLRLKYPDKVSEAARIIEREIEGKCGSLDARWLAMRLLESDEALLEGLRVFLNEDITAREEVARAVELAQKTLEKNGIDGEKLKDLIVGTLISAARDICRGAVVTAGGYGKTDRRADKILTGRWTAIPVMLVLLTFVFWLTVTGANYPSAVLSKLLFGFERVLERGLVGIGTPETIVSALVSGVYRVLAWVISVMLPPMAIFFPLFTLLEDAGYLPRVAYNLDRPFKCCRSCGKQALTMCMGFGCNAAGVTGCRIIDSPRERLIAIITNTFVPCNGRFPTLTAIITMFFVGTAGGAFSSVISALILTGVILLGIAMTFAVSRLLSSTVLKGVPSSFTLELPSFRRPQIGSVIVRSILDRTLFVLGRAAAVAAPAGLVIWLAANITVGGVTALDAVSGFLDPFARLLGLDGVILTAFILGFPANEIVVPIMIMAYMSQGSLAEMDSLAQLRELLVNNGWTWTTAVSMLIFSLMHWPCSTTMLTIKKETGSLRWSALAFAVPTVVGILLCAAFTLLVKAIS